jgi:hypothetical protein
MQPRCFQLQFNNIKLGQFDRLSIIEDIDPLGLLINLHFNIFVLLSRFLRWIHSCLGIRILRRFGFSIFPYVTRMFWYFPCWLR